MDKVNAVIGDAIKADGWPAYGAELLKAGDGPIDSNFSGCQFRVTMFNGRYEVAINVVTTGRPQYKQGGWQSRCKIEFIGDGEPSQYAGGTLYHHVSI